MTQEAPLLFTDLIKQGNNHDIFQELLHVMCLNDAIRVIKSQNQHQPPSTEDENEGE